MTKNSKLSPKQRELVSLAKRGELRRINVLEGAVSSGKTYISLFLWALWILGSPKDGLYMMCGRTLEALRRNCLIPLEKMTGRRYFSFSSAKKEAFLFGRRILLEGANDKQSALKIRGVTLHGAYCDELTIISEEFFEMLLSRLRTVGAKLIATTNPDVPTHWLKVKYLDEPKLAGDVLRVKFLLDDNIFLPKEYVESTKRSFVGVFYERFILGEWVAAEGAIYRIFVDGREKCAVNKEELPRFDYLNIGVDFGGNKSAHAFVACGISGNALYALKSRRVAASGVTPTELFEKIKGFADDIAAEFGRVDVIYADSAEQTLINGLRDVVSVPVRNSLKKPIVDRVRAVTGLVGAGRFFYLRENCASLEKALCEAVWDEKSQKDARLDDGTSDIDTLDAFEYSFERYIKCLIV